jgi:hypothetical protein
MIQLEERRLGDLVVRELTLGQVMDLRDKHPEGGNALSLAMLGACVYNGGAEPIGIEGARALPARLATKLTNLVAELTGDAEPDADGQEKNA